MYVCTHRSSWVTWGGLNKFSVKMLLQIKIMDIFILSYWVVRIEDFVGYMGAGVVDQISFDNFFDDTSIFSL